MIRNILSLFVALICYETSAFSIDQIEGRYFIKGLNDTYLSYDNNGKLSLGNFNQKVIVTIEKIQNKVAFKLPDNNYICAWDDGNFITVQPHIQSWESFTIENASDNKYFIKSHHGKYLRTNFHNGRFDQSEYRLDWEMLELLKIGHRPIGCGPYYQLDFDKLEEAKTAITALKLEENNKEPNKPNYPLMMFNKTCNEFLSACDVAKRLNATDFQNDMERCAYHAVFVEREYYPSNERTISAPKRPQRSIEEMLKIVGPSKEKIFVEAAQERLTKMQGLLPLYTKYVEFYGPWREWKFKNCIGLSYYTYGTEVQEKNRLVFETLVKSGFIKDAQVDLENVFQPDLMLMLYDFLDKNPEINELRLGDEKTLRHIDHLTLGMPIEGVFGKRAFSEEDISPHIMRVSNSFAENNDIACDAHNTVFWETLLSIKGENSFVRIKDLSWYIFGSLQSQSGDGVEKALETLKFIHRALQPQGEFSIWDFTFEGTDPVSQQNTGKLREDEIMDQIKKNVTGVGFEFNPGKSQKDTLVFNKK